MGQTNIFDKPKYKITKPIRLIELFSGYGSQALALKYLGVDFEQWRTCEWAVKSIQAYKDCHCFDDNTNYSCALNKEDLVNCLTKLGISSNYNEPMTREQISRLGEDKLRTIYNNIRATKNMVNIQQVKGQDLDITDTDKYEYIMTYSFPCQSLSLAGHQEGMAKGSGTRSGMLWEVERILDECKEQSQLPQVLIMENVPQVHGKKNIADFNMWIAKLESLGYSNYYKDLNAKDFGIPQNRNRCFMVSILGNYSYEFPKTTELKLRLKDLLEDEVDEKYYLSDSMKTYIVNSNEKWTGNNDKSLVNKTIASTLNTGEGSRRCDASNYICEDLPEDFNLKEINTKRIGGLFDKENEKHQAGSIWDANYISPTLDTAQGGYRTPMIIVQDKVGNDFVIKDTKQLKETIQQNEIVDGGSLDLYNRNVHNDGISQTLDTGYHNAQRIATKDTSLTSNLRIRKLTPLETFRLQGVKDADAFKIMAHQSDSSCFHLTGDSICVNVLMAIFKELIEPIT